MLAIIGQPRAAYIPLIAVVIIPIVFYIFHKTKNFNIPLNTFLLIILILPALVQLFNGGFINSGAVISWSAMAPISALAFKPKKEAIRCFVFFILTVIAVMTIELFTLPEFNKLSDEIIQFQFLVNLIGVVTTSFFPLLSFSKELSKSRELIRTSNQQIIQSINYAKFIQTASLSSEEELKKLLNEKSFLFFAPKDIVSGDFYWAHKDGDDVFLVCADCTGHGVPGAIMTMIGINHLNSIVRENKESDPAKILTLLHERVNYSLRNSPVEMNDGMDITICRINFNTNTVIYSSALSKVYLFDGEKVTTCPNDKCSIGDSRRHIYFNNHTLQMKSGDCLYLTTDGYADQFGGPRDKKFGSRQLTKLLHQVAPMHCNQQLSTISKSFYEWKDDTDQVDDVNFIGIKF